MTVQKKILDLTGTQYLVQKITGEIPVKISDLQDDVDMLTSHEDLHLENLPNESPNIRFINNSPQVTWNEYVYYHGDLSYAFDDEASLTSKSKIGYTNSSNSQNTIEHIYGQSYGTTKAFFTMKYYYGSNEKNAEEDESCTINSSLVFTLDPNYESAGADTYYDESNAYSDVSPNNENYFIGRYRPFKEIRAKDFVIDGWDLSLTSIIGEIGRSLEPHIADTDIHVTTADKNRWNNQTYVFRYSSTTLVASSTNSNALLDNTDNLKVGDKVIDSSGVLFSITAIDTQNSTFTIGTALIDLAQDSDVVHKSGDETINGAKTFTDNISLKSLTADYGVTGGYKETAFYDKNSTRWSYLRQGIFTTGISYFMFNIFGKDSNNQNVENALSYAWWNDTSKAYFRSDTDNLVFLGSANNRWKAVYATNYYYGSTNVEFSTKFVTTDTAQTVSGNKTFASNVNVYNSDSSTDTANIVLKNSKAERGSTTNIGEQNISFLDKDNAQIGNIKCEVDSGGVSTLTLNCTNSSNSSSGIRLRRTSTGTFLQPVYNNGCNLGTNGYRWYDVQTRSINGVEPSSLSLPSGNLNDIIDISSYLTVLDGSSANTYIAPANGWISITMSNSSSIQAYINGLWGNQIVRPTTGGIRFLMPILKDKTVNILIFGGSIDNARFIPCQGNV